MGQQPAPFATWRSQNKPTSRDSAKPMGQQTRQSNVSHPAMEPDHVTKSKSRFETDRKIPSENERKPSDFAPYGMAVKQTSRNFFISQVRIRALAARHTTAFSRPIRLANVRRQATK